MSYDKCYDKYMEKIMKEFEKKELKMRNNVVVRDRKQAIAIAISMAQHHCIMTPGELKKIEIKVMNFLLEDNRKIAKTRLPLTNVIETRILIKNLLKQKNKTKAMKLEKLLVQRITLAALKQIKINMNVWEELHTIHNMFDKK
jgi:hypothetical protein